MQLCYVDESGTPDVPGNTSHYILAGLAIPIWKWKTCDRNITAIKKRYAIEKAELHVAWIMRPYLEQRVIPNFDALDHRQRIAQVQSYRTAELLRLQRSNVRLYKQTRKNYQKTQDYIHLTYAERRALIKEVAETIGRWGFARLFAECIDKIHFDPARWYSTIDEQAFEQVVSRFEHYLRIIAKTTMPGVHGLLIHDNNKTVENRHTALMKKFHERGTLWTKVKYIIETPLFVNSELTSMVQIADLCSYALRRYVENNEDELFDLIFQRADRKDGIVVGIRHFSSLTCACKICDAHKPRAIAVPVLVPVPTPNSTP